MAMKVSTIFYISNLINFENLENFAFLMSLILEIKQNLNEQRLK